MTENTTLIDQQFNSKIIKFIVIFFEYIQNGNKNYYFLVLATYLIIFC